MARNVKRISATLMLGGISFLTLAASSLGWFIPNEKVNLDKTKGFTASSYFAGGDGSADDPYQIANPIHFYNLAWLQYLGMFNEKPESQQDFYQYSFILNNDIDMAGLVLPPIGTTKYPFIGSFDGKGHTIANSITSNKLGNGDIETKPLSIDVVEDVNIVGTFGVVGPIDGVVLDASYSSAANNVKSLVLKDAEIRTSANQTLIGAVAGYSNAQIDAVGVIAPTLNIGNGATPYNQSLTKNISDFSLVGYTSDAYKTSQIRSVTNVCSPVQPEAIEFVVQDTGTSSGWGGSLAMSSLWTRLRDIYGNYCSTNKFVYERNDIFNEDGTIYSSTPTTANTYYRYNANASRQTYDEKIGSFVFTTRGSHTGINYLSGGVRAYESVRKVIEKTRTYYLISNNASSLFLQVNNNGNLTTSNNAETATRWYLDNGLNSNGGIYYLNSSNEKRYLDADVTRSKWWSSYTYTASLKLSDSTSHTWTPTASGITMKDRQYSQTFYLSSGTPFTLSTTSGQAVALSGHNETYEEYEYTNPTLRIDYSTDDVTYFPITTESDVDTASASYKASERNTGYIIAGCDDPTSSDGEVTSSAGDIRVSRYDKGSVSTSTIYTITNGKETNFSSTSSTAKAYKKFEKSYSRLDSNLAQYAYGLHFMNATISKDSLVTARYAMVNGNEHRNYQLPANCIDFSLKEKGFINFFGGNFFSGNNSFFSLHQIERDENSDISSINEIAEIYGNQAQEAYSYVYKYRDGTFSKAYSIDSKGEHHDLVYPGDMPGGYSKLFSTSDIGINSSIKSNTTTKCYYYEIPMNDGEFALGSVEGGTGAYLLYLDISANARQGYRSKAYEKISVTESTYEYPMGIALIETANDAISCLQSAYIALGSTATGQISFSREDDEVTTTGLNSSKAKTTYRPNSMTVEDSTGGAIPLTATNVKETITTRLNYFDYYTNDESTIIVTIESVETIVNGQSQGRGANTVVFKDEKGDVIVDPEKTVVYSDEGYALTSEQIAQITTTTTGYGDIISITYDYAENITITETYVASYASAEEGNHLEYHFTGYTITYTDDNGSIATIAITVNATSYTVTVNGSSVTYNSQFDLTAYLATL